jgi:hypothetical protein
MSNTTDVTEGKPIAINPLVAFYDIHGRKEGVLFFCSVPDTTRLRRVFYDYAISAVSLQIHWIVNSTFTKPITQATGAFSCN